jgi:hypothetical protein
MFQTDIATASSTLPTPASAGTPGYFTNGNPSTGVAATILDADFMNMVMLELTNVVTGAGLTLSKTTYTQVMSAIRRIGQNTVVLTDTGVANAYTATNAVPLVAGTWVDGVVQAVKIAHANTGASTYAPDGLTAIPIYGLGLQPLQGTEMAVGGTAILMRTTIAGVNSGNSICVLMECAGGAQQVATATQSLHSVQFGQAQSLFAALAGLSTQNFSVAAATLTAHAVNLGQFASVQAANGYFKLPNGVIIQWCSGTTSGGGATLTYPIAFPNGVLAAVPIFYSSSGAANSLAINTPSKTAALVNAVNSSGSGVSGITVGCIVIGN